jgi:hypothetical protein
MSNPTHSLDSGEREPPFLNKSYEKRVSSAVAMLRGGVSYDKIRELHGGVVLDEAVELLKALRRKGY